MAYDIRNSFTQSVSGSTYDLYQDISGAAENSTNILDWDVAGIVISGAAKALWWILYVGVAADACVSMAFRLTTATAANLTSGAKQIMEPRFLQAQMSAGALLINQGLPHMDYQRFMGIVFTPFTNDNALTVNSWLADGPEPAQSDLDVVVGAS